jgi:hypothetical protein
MKKWKVTTSNQYKGGWFETELAAIRQAYDWNCKAISLGQPERWTVEADEEPEPEPEPERHPLAKILIKAERQWCKENGTAHYRPWESFDSMDRDCMEAGCRAVVAAAPPRGLTDEEPEPVDLGRVAYDAAINSHISFGPEWPMLTGKDDWRRVAAAVVAAASKKVEEPEPVDMGRVAYEAWMRCNSQCRDARWSSVAAAVIAAAPPRELTDEEIRAGVAAHVDTYDNNRDCAAFRAAVARVREGK